MIKYISFYNNNISSRVQTKLYVSKDISLYFTALYQVNNEYNAYFINTIELLEIDFIWD